MLHRAGSIAFQDFEAIGRRLAQVLDPDSEMQVLQAADRAAHDALRKPLGRPGGEQPLRFLVSEAPYHPVTPVYPVDFRPPTINNLFTLGKHKEPDHG